MQLSIVISTHPAQFQAATFKGDLETNLSRIASLGYDGVELAIRDPSLLDLDMLESLVRTYNLRVPAIGTGQAWGEEGLSFTDPDRIERDGERVLYHYVIVDYLCRWRSGEAQAASDALDVAWARPDELERYDLPPKALEVVQDAFHRTGYL